MQAVSYASLIDCPRCRASTLTADPICRKCGFRWCPEKKKSLLFMFDFDGRATRREFWITKLVTFAIFLGLFLLYVETPERVAPYLKSETSRIVIFMASVPILGLLFWATVVVYIKRWHDLGCSGLWVLLSFTPYIGPITIFVLGFGDGTVGNNRYGPDPLRRRTPGSEKPNA